MESFAAGAAPNPRRVLALCFLVAVLEGYDLQVISSAAPLLQKAMNLSPDKIGWFFSASLVGLAIGAIIGGWMADRTGRKPVLIASVLALGIFTIATAFAPNFEILMAIRVLAGVGLGGAMPTLIALMAEVTGGKRTTSAVTTMICGQPTGGIISAIVGKSVIAQFGWQSLFLVGGALTIIIVPILMRGLPETKPPSRNSHAAVPKMAVAEALFGGGRTAATLLLWLTFILTLALLSGLLAWTPLLVIGKGLPRAIGLNAVIAVNLGGIVGSLVLSRMIDRLGVRVPMLLGYGVMAISLYLFAHTQSVGMLMVVAALVGFSVLGTQFSLYGVAPQIYPLSGRGSGVGVAVALGRIGSVIGPVVIGSLMAARASENSVVLVLVPVALAAGIAIFLMTVVSRLERPVPVAATPAEAVSGPPA